MKKEFNLSEKFADLEHYQWIRLLESILESI